MHAKCVLATKKRAGSLLPKLELSPGIRVCLRALRGLIAAGAVSQAEVDRRRAALGR